MQPTNLLAQSAISKFCKEFGDVIVLRNDLIHGTQFIGWAAADQQDFDEPSMLRLKNTARGVKAISINISHNEMEANVARVKRLNLIAQAISTDFVIQRWEHHFDNAGTFIDSSVSQ